MLERVLACAPALAACGCLNFFGQGTCSIIVRVPGREFRFLAPTVRQHLFLKLNQLIVWRIENPNLLVVISAELRMLPNERFCSPSTSLKRSSFLGNKGHVRDCPYQSMQFLPALSIVLLNYYQLFEKNFSLTNDWSAYTQPWVRLILLLMPFETPN